MGDSGSDSSAAGAAQEKDLSGRPRSTGQERFRCNARRSAGYLDLKHLLAMLVGEVHGAGNAGIEAVNGT